MGAPQACGRATCRLTLLAPRSHAAQPLPLQADARPDALGDSGRERRRGVRDGRKAASDAQREGAPCADGYASPGGRPRCRSPRPEPQARRSRSARRPTPRRGSPSGPGRTRVPSGNSDHAVSPREDRPGGLHRLPIAGAAVDGEGAEAVQQPRLPALLEQLALGHVVDGTAHQRADHEGIEEAAVVGGQQQRAAARQVLAADTLQAEVDEEEGQQDRTQRPVQRTGSRPASGHARESRRGPARR